MSHVSDLQPDLEQAQQSLDLFGPRDNHCFAAFDDDKSRLRPRPARHFFGSFNTYQEQLVELNRQGAGVYFTPNEVLRLPRNADNVSRVAALFVDLDGGPVEPIVAWTPKPHLVVESSSGKFHCYWFSDGSITRDQFKPLQQALITKFNTDPQVCDLPRVMRLPGFIHRKVAKDGTRSPPFMTRIVYAV